MSANSTLPTWIANLGIWTEIDADRFIRAVGSSGTTGNKNAVNTGGTSITQAQLPKNISGTINMHNASTATHIHQVGGIFSSGQTNNNYAAPTQTVGGAQSIGVVKFDLGGSGNTHNHTPGEPKSYGFHVWVRTA